MQYLLLKEDRGMYNHAVEQLKVDFYNRTKYLDEDIVDVSGKLAMTSKELQMALSSIKALQNDITFIKNELKVTIKSDLEKTKIIEHLKNNFASQEVFGSKLSDSQTELVDIMGPHLGKLIRKNVETQIDKISAKIDATKASISSLNIVKQLKNKLGFGKDIDILDIAAPEIEDIVAIDKKSGLLLGRYSNDDHTDMDILAGMFDAIRSFAETAFRKNETQLDLIEYDSYKIKLHGYGTIYYAVIFTGRVTPEFKIFIENELDEFTNTIYRNLSSIYSVESITRRLTEEMQNYFKETCKKLERKLYS